MKNIILSLLIMLIFTACGSKQLYTLGDTSNIIQQGETKRDFIAIEKVQLPIYFMDSPIYRKDTPYHLEQIEDANWIISMDTHLTNVLMTYLQKSMNNPNIFAYPWSNVKRIDKKVSLTISTFIAYKNMVNLEANYQILDKRQNSSANYIFNTQEPIRDDSIESMIEAMEKAYFKLIKEINNKL